MPQFGAVTPVLRMFDERAARAFYVDYLGFAVQFEHRLAPDLPLYIGLVRDRTKVHLSEHHGDATPGARVRIEVVDLRAYWRELDAKTYTHARPGPPQTQPWGEIDVTIWDPFGNRLTFFETLPSPGTAPIAAA